MTYRHVKAPTEVVLIFKTHLRDGANSREYGRASHRMHELAETIAGFLSIKGYRSDDGEEIDIVRFPRRDRAGSMENPSGTPCDPERGRKEFYDRFSIQACRVF